MSKSKALRIRKKLLIAMTVILLAELALQYTLTEQDYEIIRPYTKPVIYIAILGYVILFVTRLKYKD